MHQHVKIQRTKDYLLLGIATPLMKLSTANTTAENSCSAIRGPDSSVSMCSFYCTSKQLRWTCGKFEYNAIVLLHTQKNSYLDASCPCWHLRNVINQAGFHTLNKWIWKRPAVESLKALDRVLAVGNHLHETRSNIWANMNTKVCFPLYKICMVNC